MATTTAATKSSSDDFSYRERIAVTPQSKYLGVRLESSITITDSTTTDTTVATSQVTPFPRQARQLLHSHNASFLEIQVGTSSSYSYNGNEAQLVEPWHVSNSRSRSRLDLGPSGVMVRAVIAVSTPHHFTQKDCLALTSEDVWFRLGGQAQITSLLADLVANRWILAPLTSADVKRLHRHFLFEVECHPTNKSTVTTIQVHYRLILPMEGPALSSEGMQAFTQTLSPCHNSSSGGIWSWNSPDQLSNLMAKNRKSTARHGWWLQVQDIASGATRRTTSIVKGLQFQRRLSSENTSLADLFPNSQQHRRCPLVQTTTLEYVSSTGISKVYDFVPHKQWKESLETLDDSLEEVATNSTTSNYYAVHQTLQRPRGLAYTGRWITQVLVQPSLRSIHSDDCYVSVDVQWFVPPLLQPTWQSFHFVEMEENEQSQTSERQILDFQTDLDGSIEWIHSSSPEEDATIHFRIPHWNVSTSSAAQKSSLTISMDYRPAFLSFEHFPGDANRGIEIPPAVATFVETCGVAPTTPVVLYSNSLLLLSPVPDMSMPFNVLSMVCSLYAFFIGSLVNLLIRKSSERVQRIYNPSKEPPPSKLKQLLRKGKEKLQHFWPRKEVEMKDDEDVMSAEKSHDTQLVLKEGARDTSEENNNSNGPQ